MAASQALVLAARVCLYVLIGLSFLTWAFGVYDSLFIWWFEAWAPWSRLESPALAIVYHAFRDRSEPAIDYDGTGYGEALMYGADVMVWITIMASTFAMAIFTLALDLLPRSGKQRSAASQRRLHMVNSVLHYQLPPKGLWRWWCGGLSPVDLTVWVFTVALMVMWTWQLTKGYWDYLDDEIKEGTFDTYYADIGTDNPVHWAKVEAVGNRLGWAAAAGYLLLFYPLPRSSFLQRLFRCDWSYLIRYHRWIGHLTMIALALHGLVYYVAWGAEHRFWEQLKWWQANEISNFAGMVAFVFGLLMWGTSLSWVRRNFFEVFYRSHIIGFIGFWVFSFFHYAGLLEYCTGGFILYCLDLVYRLAQWMNTSAVTGSLVTEELLTLQLAFDKRTDVRPQSTVSINVPSVSAAEWHPFTVAAVRGTEGAILAELHIKPRGKWAQKVVREIVRHGATAVRCDGPYGGLEAPNGTAPPYTLLVAGGIGITPLLGMLEWLQQAVKGSGGPERVHLVWASAEPDDFGLLSESLLQEAGQEGSWLRVSLFATRQGLQGKHSRNSSDEKKVDASQLPQLGFPVHEGLGGSPYAKQHAAFVAKKTGPFFLSPSLLQGYGFGALESMLSHLLAFTGAFMCPLTIYAWQSELHYIGDENHIPYWVSGFLWILAFMVGAMGLPALVIFPLYIFRHLQNMRREARSPQSSEHEFSYKTPNPEAGIATKVAQGRPDLAAVLSELSSLDVPSADVHVAGPTGMVHDVQRACEGLRTGQRHMYVTCHVHTFSL